jgi:hypothetical protein
MYSTSYILKIYILINLMFLILLVSNDLNLYLVLLQFISIYFGTRTIYCMIEGGCYRDVISVFLFHFLGHLLSFLYVKNYIPNTVKKFKDKTDEIRNKIRRELKKVN